MKQLSVTLSDGVQVTVYEVGEGRTGVLVVPAIFGADPGTLQAAEELAAAGARVWVFDPFFRTDPGVLGFDDPGFQRGIARARATDVAQAEADQAEILDRMPAERKLVLGICFGGKFTLLHAASGKSHGGASFHGGGMTAYLDRAEACKEALLTLHFGDQDASIPVTDVQAIAAAFGPERVVLHEGAGHGFGHPGSPRYQPQVAERAMAALKALFLT